MYCKHCGKSVEHGHNFCPSCGGRLIDLEEEPLQEHRHVAGRWLKGILALMVIGVCIAVAVALFSTDITDTVEDQLKAIKAGRITEAYYNYTSKEFQSATSLEKYKEFLKTYPEIAHSKSVRFIERNVNEGEGELQALILLDDGRELPVLFRLVKEGDKWKIVGMKLESKQVHEAVQKEASAEPFDWKPLVKAIDEQMEKVRKHQVKDAYQLYTSKEFMKSTTLDEFEAFVKSQPAFNENKQVDMNRFSFDNNVATISGMLRTDSGKEYTAEYDLVQEGDVWKILHIQVKPIEHEALAAPSQAAVQMKISKFVLGVAVDSNGKIDAPLATFRTTSGDIYLNLYLNQAKAGTKVQVAFEHLDSKSTIPPVSSTLTEDGDSVVTFIFSPPKSGWPKGNYRLVATTSTGIVSTYEFTVED